MTASDAARSGTGSHPDAIQGLAGIVSRGHAAVTVLMSELRDGFNSPMEVRPVAEASGDEWALQITHALGEVRGRVLAVTAERPALAAHIALGLAGRLVEMGAPVTVVDGSIEEPIFAKGLPEDGDEGLVDAVLFGVSSSTVARRTLMHGVRLVTAGSYPISVPAVLGAEAYRTTLQKLAREDATVLVVLPASYAPVAAAAASQLIIVERDLPRLERLTRTLRQEDDLREVRFVAVLSASEEAPIEDAPVPEEAPIEDAPVPEEAPIEDAPVTRVVPPDGVRVEEREGRRNAETASVADGVADEDVSREPALVTANNAFAADVRSAVDDETPPDGEGPSGRRWGGWIAAIVVLLIAGVIWRTGILETVFGDEDAGPVEVATSEEAPLPTVEAAALEDSAMVTAGTPDAPASAVQEPAALVTEDGRDEQPVDTGAAAARDWRAAAVSAAVPGRYVVFTSSHRYASAAEQDAAALERRGFPSVVVDVDISERGKWHRVAVDAGFRTLDDTRELLDIMKEVGYEGAWIERLREPAPPVVAPPDTSDQWMDEGGAAR